MLWILLSLLEVTHTQEVQTSTLDSALQSQGPKERSKPLNTLPTAKKTITIDTLQVKKKLKNELLYLRWKNGKVPYILSDNFSPEMRNTIQDTITDWNKNFSNCLEWYPRQKEKDYILITKGSMCHSEVGRMRGKQLIVLNEINCNMTGDILHEMSHTIGLHHEHNRPDRDDYIKVLFGNIGYGWRTQYNKEPAWTFGKLGPYDYYSLMHYEKGSPDRDKPAFVLLKGDIDEKKIGQRTGLSEIDQYKIRNLYCPHQNLNSKIKY